MCCTRQPKFGFFQRLAQPTRTASSVCFYIRSLSLTYTQTQKHICTHIPTYMYTHTFTYLHTHTCLHTHIYLNTNIQTHKHTKLYTHSHTDIYIHLYTHTLQKEGSNETKSYNKILSLARKK